MTTNDPEKRVTCSSEDYHVPHNGHWDHGAKPWSRFKCSAVVIFLLLIFFYNKMAVIFPAHAIFSLEHFVKERPKHCPQVAPLLPKLHTPTLDKMDESLLSEAFMNASVQRLSSMVQIPTESFDDMGSLDEDSRWKIFFAFAEHLRLTFPLVHSELNLEMVNTHGLLYTWQGEEKDKKPLLLMAHQDVVPVPKATVDSWSKGP